MKRKALKLDLSTAFVDARGGPLETLFGGLHQSLGDFQPAVIAIAEHLLIKVERRWRFGGMVNAA